MGPHDWDSLIRNHFLTSGTSRGTIFLTIFFFLRVLQHLVFDSIRNTNHGAVNFRKDLNPLFGRWARNMVDLFFSLKVFLEFGEVPVSYWQNESLIYPPHPGCTRGNESFFCRFASPKKYVMSPWSLVTRVFRILTVLTPMPSQKW